MAKERDDFGGILPTKFGNLDIVNQFENQKLEKQASRNLINIPEPPQLKQTPSKGTPETPQTKHIEKMTRKSESNRNQHLKSVLVLKAK